MIKMLGSVICTLGIIAAVAGPAAAAEHGAMHASQLAVTTAFNHQMKGADISGGDITHGCSPATKPCK